MPKYKVIGTLSVPYLVYVDASDESQAEEIVLRQSANSLLSNRLYGGSVEEAIAEEITDTTRATDLDEYD